MRMLWASAVAALVVLNVVPSALAGVVTYYNDDRCTSYRAEVGGAGSTHTCLHIKILSTAGPLTLSPPAQHADRVCYPGGLDDVGVRWFECGVGGGTVTKYSGWVDVGVV
jgi:hypothetical protein